MKKLLILALTLISASATAGELDGLTFCRTFVTNGGFGQPAGKRTHCVSFKDDRATDNANSFFGNPPESYSYAVEGNVIFNADSKKDTGYIISGETLVIAETGAVLKRVQ